MTRMGKGGVQGERRLTVFTLEGKSEGGLGIWSFGNDGGEVKKDLSEARGFEWGIGR